MQFQWDNGNTRHIISDYPERGNTIDELESLFTDPAFSALPDRVDNRGEQQYHAVGRSNQNRLLYVAFSIRNGQIRPFSCRPASRKEQDRYAQICEQKGIENPTPESSGDPE
ncbi:BrnT family toxin [Fibrella sp. HMF5335]|uniref:BrnT family toxin n=1 Tax=Fibrella rubiginis TaxID=2817060 RepID=A0A939K7G5_9BACT|nr:BrnT family toxin [Fibrella rubiginis]MBO0939401.1 BrnT family toxin [Fibrella rubiginis]